MKLCYILNILVAGSICITSIFIQENAGIYFPWDKVENPGQGMLLTGCHWLAITLVSIFGLLVNPLGFSVVFLHQLIYKSAYLLFSVLPSLVTKQYSQIPIGMSVFFLVYNILLLLAFPWKIFFKNLKQISANKAWENVNNFE